MIESPTEHEPVSPPDAAQPPAADEGACDSDALQPTDICWLPAWYPGVVRRRRWTVLQAWATLILIVVLATVLVTRRDDEQGRAARLEAIDIKRRQTERLIARLEQEELRLASLAKAAITVESVGLPVDFSRILADIGRGLPEGSWLRGARMSVEQDEPVAPLKRHALSQATTPPARRFVRVEVTCVTLDQDGTLTLSDALGSNPLYRQAETRETRLTKVGGVDAWEFDFTFTVPLELREAATLAAADASARPPA